MKSLIRKYLSGSGSRLDQQQLLDWLRTDGHLSGFQTEKAKWEKESLHERMSLTTQASWNSVQQQLLDQAHANLSETTKYLRFFRYAAVLLVLFSIGLITVYLLGRSTVSQEFFTMVKAEPGQIANVVLPDQTQVWLNSGSYIRYSNQYASTNRNIELVGEAFFEVTKNKELPLTVKGSVIDVKVMGTKFNVSAYPDDNYFYVALEEGKVELSSDQLKNFRYEMMPNDFASFNKETHAMDLKKVNVDLYTSWKDGMINIYNLPLEEVIVKLSKRYNQKFQVDNELKQLRYTYTIKNEALSDILTLMETITPIDVVQKGDLIHLKYNKQKMR
ncbi:FecR family protein [Gaoshiqia sp. Z1-71]|uniref:FecR family protein n=1 Tax=Gaoshiqia hydrogeniformans TaxID=3290090 RepID=UPI003BF7CBAB